MATKTGIKSIRSHETVHYDMANLLIACICLAEMGKSPNFADDDNMSLALGDFSNNELLIERFKGFPADFRENIWVRMAHDGWGECYETWGYIRHAMTMRDLATWEAPYFHTSRFKMHVADAADYVGQLGITVDEADAWGRLFMERYHYHAAKGERWLPMVSRRKEKDLEAFDACI